MAPTSPGQPTHHPPFFWIAALLSVVIIGAYLFAGVTIFRYGLLTKEYGWKCDSKGYSWYVTEVATRGVAAGKLHVGDQILAINHDTRIQQAITGHLHALERYEPIQVKLRAIAPGQPYTMRVSSNGVEYECELTASVTRDTRHLLSMFSILAASLVVCGVALVIGMMKPGEQVVQLMCIGLLALGINQIVDGLRPINEFFHGTEQLLYFAMFSVYPFNAVLGYHFFYRFPPGIPEGRWWTRLKNFFYLGAIVLGAQRKWIQWTIYRDHQEAIPIFLGHVTVMRGFSILSSVFELLVCASLIAVLVRNYRLAVEADQRRRIQWIMYGSAAAVLPWGLSRLISFLFTSFGYNYFVLENLFDVTRNLAVALAPISIAYCIAKHRVFDVTVVIRRSLQYMLAKNVLQAVMWLPVIVIGWRIIRNPNQTIAEIVLSSPFSFALLVASAVSLRYRTEIRTWIDRRFFREAYDQEQILLGLVEDIKNLDSMAEIAKLVSRQLESSLHPKGIFVLYHEGKNRELTLGYTSEELTHNQISIAENSPLFQMMERETAPREVSFSDGAFAPEDTEWIKSLGISLIVPMKGTDRRLVGLLTLGEKKSEELYSSRDRKLLQAIAGQMAVSYEVAQLKEHINREHKIKQEVLARFEEQHLNLVKECPRCGDCFDSQQETCPKDGSELALSLPVERTVAEKYRLDRLLGKGGMGAVYEATDLRLNRKVAIKILIGNLFGDQAALRRFEREARTSANLSHPNIITVYDYGRLNQEGAFLVMELVPGETLREALDRRHALPPQEAAEVFDQMCEGLNKAHQAGVIHRDLKPENIFLSRLENGKTLIKILDFGIAKAGAGDTTTFQNLTSPGMILGTLGYMSPEQIAGEELDERADIFSLGVMVVEMLTGERPFKGKNLPELLMSMLRDSYHLKGSSPKVKTLDDLLQQCLARRAEERFPSVATLQAAIIPAIRHCPPLATVKSAAVRTDTLIDDSQPTQRQKSAERKTSP